jgi:hypothetical protein
VGADREGSATPVDLGSTIKDSTGRHFRGAVHRNEYLCIYGRCDLNYSPNTPMPGRCVCYTGGQFTRAGPSIARCFDGPYVVSAAGGNGESMDPFDEVQPPFSAFRSINNSTCAHDLCSDFGFSTITVWNTTTLEMCFWSYGDGKNVAAPMVRTDHVWLHQDVHGVRVASE